MAQVRPRDGYTSSQKALHWAVVVLLVLQYLVFEEPMGPAFRSTLETGTPVLTTWPVLHIATGVLILLLALARLAMRAKVGAPPAPESEPALARVVSRIVHFGLYALIILLPLVGLAAYFLPSGELGELHEVGTNLLLAFAGLHVLGALVNQFWWKNGLIGRMI